MMMSETKRLWDVNHPYHCNDGNFFSNDCVDNHDSWRDFVAEQGDADKDMNLVFRWDWTATDKDEAHPRHVLQICWTAQRKGIYRTSFVRVEERDEPAIRAWLVERFTHLLKLWEPLS